MTRDIDPKDEALLDACFAEARREVVPTASLMDRILQDAADHQPRPIRLASTAPAGQGRGGLFGILDLIGGWPTMGGLATAAVAGVWIGLAGAPATLSGAIGLASDSEAVELLPGTDAIGLVDLGLD